MRRFIFITGETTSGERGCDARRDGHQTSGRGGSSSSFMEIAPRRSPESICQARRAVNSAARDETNIRTAKRRTGGGQRRQTEERESDSGLGCSNYLRGTTYTRYRILQKLVERPPCQIRAARFTAQAPSI